MYGNCSSCVHEGLESARGMTVLNSSCNRVLMSLLLTIWKVVRESACSVVLELVLQSTGTSPTTAYNLVILTYPAATKDRLSCSSRSIVLSSGPN